jgi:hypothetical protein
MILRKTELGWEGEFKGFTAFQPVPEDFKSARGLSRNPDTDAMHKVTYDVKQLYLRSIAAPGKQCMRDGLEYVLIEVYDHYLVSDGKGPLQGFDTLDWIEGSEW